MTSLRWWWSTPTVWLCDERKSDAGRTTERHAVQWMIYVEIILKQILSPISRRGGRAIGFIRVENGSQFWSAGVGFSCDFGEGGNRLIIGLRDNFTKSLSMFRRRYFSGSPEDVL